MKNWTWPQVGSLFADPRTHHIDVEPEHVDVLKLCREPLNTWPLVERGTNLEA